MVVKDGRFGPYVTDGTTNASLRKGDDVDTLTVERASSCWRSAGRPDRRPRRRPPPRRPRPRSGEEEGPDKKAAAKKAPAKKAAATKAAAPTASAGPSAPAE